MNSGDRQIFVTENWEFVKIKSDESYWKDIYVLLHIVETKYRQISRELKIKIIPINMPSYIYTDSRKFKSWKVKVTFHDGLNQGKVKFGSDGGYFVIEPENLRSKGLGRYVVNKFVEWVQQFPSELLVHLYAKPLDDSSPDNAKRVNSLYRKCKLLDAKTIGDIQKAPSSNRITSFSIGKFSSSLIRENMYLKDDLSKCNKECSDAEDKYQRTKNLLKACGVIILIQVGIIYVLIGKII